MAEILAKRFILPARFRFKKQKGENYSLAIKELRVLSDFGINIDTTNYKLYYTETDLAFIVWANYYFDSSCFGGDQ